MIELHCSQPGTGDSVYFEYPDLYQPKTYCTRGGHLPKFVFDKSPDTLFILFSFYPDEQDFKKWIHPTKTNWKPIIDFIVENYSQVTQIKFVPVDVPSDLFDETEKLANLKAFPEFVFYKKIKKAMPLQKMQFYYFQSSKYPYADPWLYRWLTQGDYKLPSNNIEITKKLSMLVNYPRRERRYLVTLLHDFDIELTCLKHLKWHYNDEEFTDLEIKHKYHNNYVSVSKQFNKNTIDMHNHYVCTVRGIEESFQLIQNGFCNIVTEDPYWRVGGRITEKTPKAMMSYRPFIMCGSAYTLEWLQSQGFKTFSHWWDESYDEETDHWRRLERIYRLSEYINSLSLSDCKQILKEMEPVLKFNRAHLLNNFTLTTIKNLYTKYKY